MEDQTKGEQGSTGEKYTEPIDTSTSQFENLPVEVTQKIFEKLPFKALICCSFLSKTFFSVLNDQHFAFRLFSIAAENNPLLFITCGNSVYFLDLASAEISESKPLDELKKIDFPFQLADIFMVGSCNGYLCLSASSSPSSCPAERSHPFGSLYDDVTYLWNPITTHFVELPASPKELSWGYGFGFHPITRERKIVKISYAKDARGTVVEQHLLILTLGKDLWRRLKAPSNIWTRGKLRTMNRGVCVNGSMHWLAEKYENPNKSFPVILALDLATEELAEIPLPECIVSQRCENLLEISGCLALVVYDHADLLKILVMENYGLKDSWALKFVIENFGKRARMHISKKAIQGEIIIRGGLFLYPSEVICLLGNGKLLIQFPVGGIVCYDCKAKCFIDFYIRGLPNFIGFAYDYEATTLTGSFIRI